MTVSTSWHHLKSEKNGVIIISDIKSIDFLEKGKEKKGQREMKGRYDEGVEEGTKKTHRETDL